jgi:hypothetical protein
MLKMKVGVMKVKIKCIKVLQIRLRDKLNECAVTLGTGHAKTLRVSQQLDKVINVTQRELMA